MMKIILVVCAPPIKSRNFSLIQLGFEISSQLDFRIDYSRPCNIVVNLFLKIQSQILIV